MQRTEIIKRLSRLTERERAVLGYFCLGLNYWKIGNEIGLSEGTVKSHMYHIFNKLELGELGRGERRTIVLEQFCPVLKAGDLDLPPEEPTQLVPLPLGAREEIDALQYEIIEYNPDNLVLIPDNPEEPPCLGRLLLAVILLATLGGLFMWGPGLADRYFNPIPVETRIAQGIQATLEEQHQLETLVAELYIASQPAASETGMPPSETPTIQPTITIRPTIRPSLTPIPTAAILFEDNFNQGLSPSWSVLSGSPIVVNGMLTASEETWLVIGDSSWTDYEIEFQAQAADCWFSWSSNVVGLRVINQDNMVAYRWAFCESYWFIVQNGTWMEVPNSEGDPGADMRKFLVRVQGGEFSVYVDGVKESSFFNNEFAAGGIILSIAKDTLLDNLIIRLIDG